MLNETTGMLEGVTSGPGPSNGMHNISVNPDEIHSAVTAANRARSVPLTNGTLPVIAANGAQHQQTNATTTATAASQFVSPRTQAEMQAEIIRLRAQLRENMARPQATSASPTSSKASSRIGGTGKRRASDIAIQSALVTYSEIPHSHLLIDNVPYGTILMRKFMQATIYLWTVNLSTAPVNWIDTAHARVLSKTLETHRCNKYELSGLALLLFTPRKNSFPDQPYETSLGKTFIAMESQAITRLFTDVRRRHFCDPITKKKPETTSAIFTADNPQWNAPTYITHALATRYHATEAEHTHIVIRKFSKSPNAGFGYLPLNTKKVNTSSYIRAAEAEGIDKDIRIFAGDEVPMTQRCKMLQYCHQKVKAIMHTVRNDLKQCLYEQFFFVVRMIQANPRGPYGAKTDGYWIEWGGTQDQNLAETPADLLNAENWVIPDAKTDCANDAEQTASDKFNRQQIRNLHAQFKSMTVKVHWSKQARSPTMAEDNNLMQQYHNAAKSAPLGYLSHPRVATVSFYTVAMKIWELFLGGKRDDAYADVMRASKYSIRAIHVLALGIRAATLEATGGTGGHADAKAWLSVTTHESIKSNDMIMMALLLGADPTGGALSAEKTLTTRAAIEKRVATMSYSEYRAEAAERAEALANGTATQKKKYTSGHTLFAPPPPPEAGTPAAVSSSRAAPRPVTQTTVEDEDADAY